MRSSRSARCSAGCMQGSTGGSAGEIAAGLRADGVARDAVLRLRDQGARGDELGPAVEDGDLVPARAHDAEVAELGPVPVGLEVGLALELGHLDELVAIVVVPVDRMAAGAVAQRDRRDVGERLGELVAAEAGRVPGDVDDAGHQPPTSARIAPGPETVRPRPSSVAPTRMAIFPQCLFSCMSWWASATWSKPIVRQSTGRTLPCSMSSLAFVHSHALAKCEPRISFWRIHR